MPTDIKPLFRYAVPRDIRAAAQACRDLPATVDHWGATDADDVRYFIEDMGGWPDEWRFTSWADAAKLLDAEADRLDPPPPRTILYVTCPSSYDGFSVRELDANAGTDNRGKIVRKVSVEDRDTEWFRTRAGSGLHATATEEEVEQFKSVWRLKTED